VLAGWTMIAVSVVSDVGLAALALVGLVTAQRQAASLDLVEVILGAALLAVALVIVVRRGSRTGRGRVTALRLIRLSQRVFRRPRGDARQIAARFFERLGAVRPSWRDWTAAFGCALGNWTLDCACLGLAFAAVGAPVPWRGLLLAYGGAQLAANLPITPGGLGVVEGSLSIALVYYGGVLDSTVAAVLLYRIISYWALLPFGWSSWALLRWTGRRRARHEGGSTA
jgi:uncharacterized protein (TIRG00374 family)